MSFLTIIPTGVHDLKLASEHFYLISLIGFVEGTIASIPILLDAPPEVSAALILTLSYLITGFNHLDGFADFADALGSRAKGEDALRIMKEPGRGGMSIAMTILMILVAYSSLSKLVMQSSWHIIVSAHILASESAYLLASISRPPDYQGLSREFIVNARSVKNILVNLIITAGLLIPLFFAASRTLSRDCMVIVLPLIPAILYTRAKAHEVLGFINGDVLGFCYELTKTAILASAVCFTALG